MIHCITERTFVVDEGRIVIRKSAFEDFWTDAEGNELPMKEQARFEAQYQREHAD